MVDSLFSVALAFFLIANPIGNTPGFIALVKHFDLKTQRKILVREAFIALAIALFFQFLGEYFLGLLMVQDFALRMCGGCLLFLTALRMIFPPPPSDYSAVTEPMIVPIATPMITGPGLMTTIMIYAKEAESTFLITAAIFVTWIGILLVLNLAPYLKKLIGDVGLTAMEQLMGMVLSMISMQLFVSGLHLFVVFCNH
jgi:multiple antibiotic resistance protein